MTRRKPITTWLSAVLLLLSMLTFAVDAAADDAATLVEINSIRQLIKEGDIGHAKLRFQGVERPEDDYASWMAEYYLTEAELMFALNPTEVREIRAVIGLAQGELSLRIGSPLYADVWLLQLRLNATDRELDSVMSQIDQVVELAVSHKRPELAIEALLFAAELTNEYGFNLLGFELLQRASAIESGLGSARMEAELALAYGKFYGSTLILKRSISELNLALDYFKLHGPFRRYIDSHIAIGQSYFLTSDYQQAEAHILLAERLASESDLAAQHRDSAYALARIRLAQGEWLQAREYALKALALSISLTDQFDFFKMRSKIALAQNDLWTAEAALNRAFQHYNQLPQSKQETHSGIEVWQLSAMLAAGKERFQQAWHYAQKYEALEQQAQRKVGTSGIESLLIELDVTQLNSRNRRLLDSNHEYQTKLAVAAERLRMQNIIDLLTVILVVFMIAFFARLVYEKRRLAMLANTDALTGLNNRRVGLERTQTWLSQHPDKELSVVLIDIDFFKKVNDQHGHQVGDQVLQQFAQILRDHCRGKDIVARLGGEEFLLALPCDQHNAMQRAEALRASCEQAQFSNGLRVTASFGVVVGKGHPFELLYEKADQALYQAKRERNKVELVSIA
ncbi:GGDEF domain-containing protein [Corallincola luteus]|uniref:diguanylate cyclase n=1 Tax=Corallincola luteus TaxID=1775177 RepID=A0ABY2AI63_9GAMM|nr:GGDEF domain-containing protein [Corallincola luteus]TCI01323.1 GGDEF domain-containing protein [Corallincola luteus]